MRSAEEPVEKSHQTMVWLLSLTNHRTFMARLHALIHGHVQGVFFRSSIEERAQDLGLSGWVRNRSDGAVEVVAEGREAALTALRDYCKKGPPGAVVRDVELIDEHETGDFDGFRVR